MKQGLNQKWLNGGVLTALITPFDKDGRFDEKRFRLQVQRQIAAGVKGIVPMGTTGESPTVSHREHIEVVASAVRSANRKGSVIAGAGSNSTAEAVRLTRAA